MSGMTVTDAKDNLRGYLQDAREALLWKLDGLSEYDVTLHQILVHVAADTCRHAGHADITRELIDGAVGLTARNSNMSSGDEEWWSSYRDQVDRAAREAASHPASG